MNVYTRSTAALLVVLLTQGCATTHGLTTHGQLMSSQSLEQRSLSTQLSPAPWPAQDWWRGFGDPQLTTLIEEALQGNPSLDEAQARSLQARAQAQVLNAARMPQVGLSAELTGAMLSREDPLYPSDVLGKFGWEKSIAAQLSWDLDIWGGRRAAWEAAVGRGYAAQIDVQAARIELSVNVARAYVRLSYAFEQQDITDQERQRAQRSLEITRQLLAAGLGTPQQGYMADAQLASAEQAQQQAARSIDAARSRLSILLGRGPDRGLAIERPQLRLDEPLPVPDDLAINLLGRRPDLVAGRWEVEASAHDIKASKAQFLPNLSLSAMAGLVVLGNTNLLDLSAKTYSVGPALTLPIFEGGRLRAHLAAADARYDQSVAHYNGTLIAAINEVADLLSEQSSVRSQMELEQRVSVDAQKGWDDAMTAYRGGMSGQLTPLIVRGQLLTAQQTLAALRYQQADNHIRMIAALGGGFDGQVGITASD